MCLDGGIKNILKKCGNFAEKFGKEKVSGRQQVPSQFAALWLSVCTLKIESQKNVRMRVTKHPPFLVTSERRFFRWSSKSRRSRRKRSTPCCGSYAPTMRLATVYCWTTVSPAFASRASANTASTATISRMPCFRQTKGCTPR